jgi:hypothetical protein
MANSTLANLTASGALTGTELLYSDNGSADVKVTANQLKTFIVGVGSVSVASGKTLTVSNTLTLAGTDGKTLTVSNNLTLAGNDGSTLNIGAGGTLGSAAFVNTGTSGGTVPLLNVGNTFSATQTITPAANANALAVTGYSLTGANAQSLLDLAGTWNTSGVPTAVKVNITNTASAGSSKLVDYQVGGVSKYCLFAAAPNSGTIQIAGANFGGWAIINGSDASVLNNFEYLAAYVNSNIFQIESAHVGTGSNRTIRFNIGPGNAAFDITGNGNGVILYSATPIPAGGTVGIGYKFSTTSNFGIFFGSGAPTLSAAQGSLYIRSDGSATNNRAYINTDGSTTWTALTTAA